MQSIPKRAAFSRALRVFYPPRRRCASGSSVPSSPRTGSSASAATPHPWPRSCRSLRLLMGLQEEALARRGMPPRAMHRKGTLKRASADAAEQALSSSRSSSLASCVTPPLLFGVPLAHCSLRRSCIMYKVYTWAEDAESLSCGCAMDLRAQGLHQKSSSQARHSPCAVL